MRVTGTPQGLGAKDIQAAYELPAGNVAKTVAVVIKYGYPNAEADLHEYRTKFGLGDCLEATGCLKIVNKYGNPGPLPVKAPEDDDWTLEGALDLAMASTGCPSCNLVLVEADDDKTDGDAPLFAAQKGAVKAGANVVSNSWGTEEAADGGVSANDVYFHGNATFFASSGDYGHDDARGAPDYPASSSLVTAVGGTTLTQDAADPGNPRGWTEVGWSWAGSGCSVHIPKPGWQAKAVPDSLCARRATSDVSAVADNVAVFNADGGGWRIMAGTSASTPLVAAIFAATGHWAAPLGFPYSNQGSFFDVTSGSNGSCAGAMCDAGVGWDGLTGVGSPNGATLTTSVAPSGTPRLPR